MSSIYCLFSVENNYDQPKNNLVAWWVEKPSFDTLAKAIGWGQFPCATDEGTLYIVNLWQGVAAQTSPGETLYRLEQVDEGAILD